MKDVVHSWATAQANWGAIGTIIEPNGLIGISGSSQSLQMREWSGVSGSVCDYEYYQIPKDTILTSAIEIFICGHCDQRHRVDTSRLAAVEVLDCKNCGAPLI